MSQKKKIVILGSTGSIGENAVKVAIEWADRFEVVGLAACNRVERLAEQAAELNCSRVVTSNADKAAQLAAAVPDGCFTAGGEQAVIDLAASSEAELVLCAIVGAGGLLPTLAAIEAGRDIALANKEVMVIAGELVTAAARRNNVNIIPVDSEHSAIFQCLAGCRREEVASLVLTASGGPFRDASADEIAAATYEKALAHPTWDMGPKVTVDSASMMNKALEIVEAGYLFDMPPEKIKVLIHPQSVVHSMIELVDGSMQAQLSAPDMRYPIQYAMSWPERLNGNMPRLDFRKCATLTFQEPDPKRFPALGFAYEALRRGGTLPAVMNAANEVAVEKFRKAEIAFPEIWSIIEAVMAAHRVEPQQDIDTALAADKWARKFAETL